MMTENGRKAITRLIASTAILGVVCYICHKLEQKADRTRERLRQELLTLPTFSPEAETIRIMQEFKFDDKQLNAAYIPVKTLQKQIDDVVARQVSTRFNDQSFAQGAKDSQRGIRPARINDLVTFTAVINNKRVKVKGTFQMREKNASGLSVFVNGKFYKLKQIDQEYRYLFDESMCEKTKAARLKEFDAEFTRKRDEYSSKIRADKELSVFPLAGYLRYHDGKWMVLNVDSEEVLVDIRLLLNVKRKRVSKT